MCESITFYRLTQERLRFSLLLKASSQILHTPVGGSVEPDSTAAGCF
jgi:hypothetical protein